MDSTLPLEAKVTSPILKLKRSEVHDYKEIFLTSLVQPWRLLHRVVAAARGHDGHDDRMVLFSSYMSHEDLCAHLQANRADTPIVCLGHVHMFSIHKNPTWHIPNDNIVALFWAWHKWEIEFRYSAVTLASVDLVEISPCASASLDVAPTIPQ